MSFKDAVIDFENTTTTANGMKALKSSLNANVDLFYKIGASRGKDISSDFDRALGENPELALRILLWSRDIRGGAGERVLFRNILKHLETNHFHALELNPKFFEVIPEVGRFDDLLVFSHPALKIRAYTVIRKALLEGNQLAAKWMPRKGPLAVELRSFLGMTPKAYRKMLVSLTNVVETPMSANRWDEINYEHVPSKAMTIYSKAFERHSPEKFSEYTTKLSEGTAKVNASAVFPYDVTRMINTGNEAVANQMWESLPDYIGEASVLPLVDVSGSMLTTIPGTKLSCMDVAVSLGLYISTKAKGAFKDLWINFSESANFVHATGSLSQKLSSFKRSDWGMNTNLVKAFTNILEVAKNGNVDPKDMPETLLILSDMQFDIAVSPSWNSQENWNPSAIQMIRQQYENYGYKMPTIVFWNLNAQSNVPVKYDENGTAMVSGFSPAIMKAVLGANIDTISPENIMLDTVMTERYNFKG